MKFSRRDSLAIAASELVADVDCSVFADRPTEGSAVSNSKLPA